jgi:hypothetical protein
MNRGQFFFALPATAIFFNCSEWSAGVYQVSTRTGWDRYPELQKRRCAYYYPPLI